MNNLATGPITGYLSFDYDGAIYIMRYSPDNKVIEILWQIELEDQQLSEIFWDTLPTE